MIVGDCIFCKHLLWCINGKKVKYGQKPIDIRPCTRYNICNLIRKLSNHCCKLNRNGGQLRELGGTEWLHPPGASSTGRAPKGALQR